MLLGWDTTPALAAVQRTRTLRGRDYEEWLLSMVRGAANGEECTAMSATVDHDLVKLVHQFIRRKVRSGEWGADTRRSRSAVLIDLYESTRFADITRIRERHLVDFIGRKRSDGAPVSHGTLRNRLGVARVLRLGCPPATPHPESGL